MIEYYITFLGCLLAGVLTGITGLGGGLVIVPLFVVLQHFGFLQFSMYEIVGVSATVVFFNSIITLFYRRNEKFLPFDENIKNIISVIFGAFLGSYLSSFAPEKILNFIYIILAASSIFLIKKEIAYKFKKASLLKFAMFFAAGFLTSAVGVGGALVMAIILKMFYNKKTKELMPTIVLLVTINASFAFFGKIFAKDVVYYLVPVIVVASFMGSKIGVLISKNISSKNITNLMIIATLIGIVTVFVDML